MLQPMEMGLFLDRDGVVIENVVRDDGTTGSPRTESEVHVVSSFANFAKRASEFGYRILIITNQPDVARGFIALKTIDAMNDDIKNSVPQIDSFYVCPHDDRDNCPCRKPKPGLIAKAAADLNISLHQSWVVGDRSSDIEAGFRIGVRGICVPSLTHNGPQLRACESQRPHLEAKDFEMVLATIKPR